MAGRREFRTGGHWGVFHVQVEDGRGVGTVPFDSDPNPTPLIDSAAVEKAFGDQDVLLYAAVVERIRAGESYYLAAAREMHGRGYATAPVFNWRLPTLALAQAAMPPAAIAALLVALGAADEARDWVRWIASKGADGIKFFGAPPEIMRAALTEARAQGLLTEAEFEARLRGSAIRRIGYERWLRNLAVGLGNAPHSAEVVEALRARANHPSALVREHVLWALARHVAA